MSHRNLIAGPLLILMLAACGGDGGGGPRPVSPGASASTRPLYRSRGKATSSVR
jgi:hypothetical protein